MAKNAEILPSDVLVELKARGRTTRRELANALGCSKGTISRKIAVLVMKGENIGFDREGLFIQTDIDYKEDGFLTRKWVDSITHHLEMWATRGNNHRAVAIEVRKRFAKELSRQERDKLKDQLLLISRVIDAVNLDEELAS